MPDDAWAEETHPGKVGAEDGEKERGSGGSSCCRSDEGQYGTVQYVSYLPYLTSGTKLRLTPAT